MSEIKQGSIATEEELKKDGWQERPDQQGTIGSNCRLFIKGEKAISWDCKTGKIIYEYKGQDMAQEGE